MAEDNYTDTKKIEEKALNFLKTFIEDSSMISQFIADNDKEPCWDGHLYLYSEGRREKNHLLGRVPVQVKGTEVNRFQTNKWKFKLEKDDLRAYLYEPTFFIVCQIKKNSKERKLFYRELLPNTVKNLLHDMDKQKTKSVLFHPLTLDLKEFEGQLLTFMRNSKKMISFADSKPFTMQDAVKKGVKDYAFSAPVAPNDRINLLKYLTTHDTYLYAKVEKDLNIEVPIDGGPMKFTFIKDVDGDVCVNGKVYYHGYSNTIKNGRIIVNVADVLTLNFPIDTKDKRKIEAKMTTKSKYLDSAIHEMEFAMALHHTGKLSIGNLELNMKVNEPDLIEEMQERLDAWKELQSVLKKLHVTKPFDLTSITDEQERLIDVLVNTVGKGHTVNIPGQETTLTVMEISNVKLLLWCAANKDGICKFGDFFDKSIRISYKVTDTDIIDASPFSYLQNDNLWERCDNINYSDVIDCAKVVCDQHEYGFVMANYDVLAMITAADALKEFDKDKWKKLLETACKLTEWLIKHDIHQDMVPIHICNKMQIIKRQRAFTKNEIALLERTFEDANVCNNIKTSILLLLDKQKEFDDAFANLTKEEQEMMHNTPIWKYNKSK